MFVESVSISQAHTAKGKDTNVGAKTKFDSNPIVTLNEIVTNWLGFWICP